MQEIIRLADKFKIKMIAASDSHKGCQVGLCCTKILVAGKNNGAKAVLETASQDQIELLVDRHLLEKYGRRNSRIQNSNIYQRLLPVMPKIFRRAVKILRYRVSRQKYAQAPSFKKIEFTSFL